VAIAEGEVSVALEFVPRVGVPVDETELDNTVPVVPVPTAALEVEDTVGCEVVPEESMDVVATAIVELLEATDPEATKPLQIKATASTPAIDSHVSSLLFGTRVFSFEHPASPYVAQSA
jgi:hypothetical protein